MVVSKKKTSEDVISKNKITCMLCHREIVATQQNFFQNNNPLFDTEKFPTCKKCVIDYLGNSKEVGYEGRVKMLLALLNKPFLEDLWVSSGRNWAKYFPQIASLKHYLGKTFLDSDFIYRKSGSYLGVDDNDEFEEIEIKKFSKHWNGLYTKSEIEYLDNYYSRLCDDYSIATANHEDYARKMCQASLLMDKCYRAMSEGDDSASKKYKEAKEIFDGLSKSANFSASSRSQADVGLGGFGVTFELVESAKYVPKHIPIGEDDVDKLIGYFSSIEKSV